MIEKGMKKGGKMHIFSPIGKSMHMFSPIDLKCTILPKKRLKIFHLRRAPPHYIKFNLGEKLLIKKGGQKYEFQI